MRYGDVDEVLEALGPSWRWAGSLSPSSWCSCSVISPCLWWKCSILWTWMELLRRAITKVPGSSPSLDLKTYGKIPFRFVLKFNGIYLRDMTFMIIIPVCVFEFSLCSTTVWGHLKVPYSKLNVYCLSAMYSSSPAPLQLILISLWQREILYTEWIAFTTIYLSEAIIVSHMPISPDFSHNHFQYFWPCSCWSESFLLVRIKLHLDQQNNLKSLTQRLLSYLSYTFLLTQLMRVQKSRCS